MKGLEVLLIIPRSKDSGYSVRLRDFTAAVLYNGLPETAKQSSKSWRALGKRLRAQGIGLKAVAGKPYQHIMHNCTIARMHNCLAADIRPELFLYVCMRLDMPAGQTIALHWECTVDTNKIKKGTGGYMCRP